MPIIDLIERKTVKGRVLITWMYLTLMLGGAAMVYPFLVMMTGSTSCQFDYERRSVVPRYLYSREDRLMRTLCLYFPQSIRNSMRTMRMYFPDMREDWLSWKALGDEYAQTDQWASKRLAELDNPEKRAHLENAAKDYSEFVKTWDVHETILAFNTRYVAPFLRTRYGNTTKLNEAWNTSTDDFYKVTVPDWSGEPIDQSQYVPVVDLRYKDLLAFRDEYAKNRYTSYLNGPGAHAGFLRPASIRYLWEDYVAKNAPGIDPNNVDFPVSSSSSTKVREQWKAFMMINFPMRHVQIPNSPEWQSRWTAFLKDRFHTIVNLNSMLNIRYTDWSQVKLTPTIPYSDLSVVWIDFTRKVVPLDKWELRESLPELAYQRYALAKYGSLDNINIAYGTTYTSLNQLEVPYGSALLVTFANREWPITLSQAVGNYSVVTDYLFLRGRSVINTVILVLLALLISLTVNPLAGYALSRFRLRGAEKILLFCLATMAFPAAVTAIPGFLLLRDLGFLNTFWALVLPGAANGMTIFLLKGFFDSLPMELFEAATVDGAPEHLIFRVIALPLVKPILAVGALNAFLAAYNGWEWALVVCQNQKMWTIAVWTYQMYQILPEQWVSMAGFVLTSIPVLIVFIMCQKVIMRGIILPQMK